ncbi:MULTISPECIES: acetyl-CoA C-acetyltransferase [unclassified Candidatus Lariskella]|uniref:acetyl-CoA C-acetyltransferase n=1 Tax=unclassified Candidatus Lariskella TaxID=2632605 RepID=UPI0030D0148D
MNQEIAIVGAFRTAIGNLNGTVGHIPAYQLSSHVINHLLNVTHIKRDEISEVILGQVLLAGTGQNPARQAAMHANIPQEVPAFVVNQVCGSGLKAIMTGAYSIANGAADIVIAGGQESMTCSPHFVHMRKGVKLGNATLADSMIVDGLTDAFENVHMGITAENIAEKFKIFREEQDQFALFSQMKAEEAQKSGRFTKEIVPISFNVRQQEVIFAADEFVRSGTTIEGLAKLSPAFKQNGTVTAGNSSGVNDGAAVVILMDNIEAKMRGLKIMGTIKSFAQSGVSPDIMGTGPVAASQKALLLAGWKVEDLDLIESNEAFAVQAIYVNRAMGWDEAKVNVNGGAIALGHPIGASGARILVTLLHEMERRNAKRGLATLCIGGGMGIAICVER